MREDLERAGHVRLLVTQNVDRLHKRAGSRRVVDLHGIDRVVVSLGQRSVGFARWLWRVVDLRGVDRVVVGVGKQNLGFAHWLWKMVEVKVLDKKVNRLGDQAEATGDMMRELEPRTLQHHLLVMIFWLIVGMGLLFWFVV